MLNNLTTLAESTKKKPDTATETETSHGINPPFSIKAWCLTHTSQILSWNARQKLCTKATIFWTAILESLKMETDSQYYSQKTKPLHRAVPTTTTEK
ncbi:hypothetical protein G9A89_003359 [Geosiphon pyriformis]|nr:hypothetical protein G9A89_003359 [Geosiphon pyriformis]